MKIKRKQELAWRRVGTETVLIDLETNRMFGLNETAGEVWDQLCQGSVERHALEAGLERAEAGKAGKAFLDDLLEAGLIEEIEGSETTGGFAENLATFTCGGEPKLLWHEQVRNFGQSGAFCPGESQACDTNPDPNCPNSSDFEFEFDRED